MAEAGLQGNSPFYAGFNVTLPKVTAPTGLADLSAVIAKGGADGLVGTAKKKSGTKGTATETQSLIPGTIGTSQSLVSQAQAIDSEIAKTKSAMLAKFKDKATYPTNEAAVKGVKAEYDLLGQLYAKKNALKAQIPVSNQDLQNWQTAGETLKTNNTLGQPAMKLVGNAYVPYGVNETNNILTYDDIHGEAFLADNTTTDESGNLAVVPKKYNYNFKQNGAFKNEVVAGFTNAAKARVGGGSVSEGVGDEVGLIRSATWSGNKDAINNAAQNMYAGLSTDAQADIGGQFFKEVKDIPDISNLRSGDTQIYTEEEELSVRKALKGEELSEDDTDNIASATAKYASLKINKEKTSYLSSTYTPSLKGGRKGSGGAGDVEMDFDEITEQEKSITRSLAEKEGLTEEERTNLLSQNISIKAKEIPFSKPVVVGTGVKYVYDPNTGLTEKTIAEKKYNIWGLSKVNTTKGDVIMALATTTDNEVKYLPYEGNAKVLIKKAHPNIKNDDGYTPKESEVEGLLFPKNQTIQSTTTETFDPTSY